MKLHIIHKKVCLHMVVFFCKKAADGAWECFSASSRCSLATLEQFINKKRCASVLLL